MNSLNATIKEHEAKLKRLTAEMERKRLEIEVATSSDDVPPLVAEYGELSREFVSALMWAALARCAADEVKQ